jgi:glycerol-1-phosphate dehydrogenase [NAD(P)+]
MTSAGYGDLLGKVTAGADWILADALEIEPIEKQAWSLAHGHEPVPHGFKVGVGTQAAAALYERVLALDLTKLDIDARCRLWPSREEVRRQVEQVHSIPKLAQHAVEESLAKYIPPEQLRQRLMLLQQHWPVIRERLERQLMRVEHIRTLLRAAGCPTEPAKVGVSVAQLRQSYTLARTIRSRYSVLDLVNEAGILDACVNELFASSGYWAALAHP